MDIENTILPTSYTFEQLMEQSLKDLEGTQINHNAPGSIVKLILTTVNNRVADFHKTLKTQHVQVFLSKAKESTLDSIGAMFNCTRVSGETDENYRYRISKQNLSLERANETAIRLAVLSVEGVKDVIMREYTHGTGSFSVYPILDDPYEWNNSFTNEVRDKLKDVRAYGSRAVVLQPRLLATEIKGHLITKEALSPVNKALVSNQVTQAVRAYINTLKPGEVLDIFHIKSLAKQAHESIVDVNIYHFVVNNRAMLTVNQESSWNERFVEATVANAILFS